jgi:hypothetical protein
MRDQDMADVDVTTPGVWERASDAAFEEVKQRELDDEANGIIPADGPSRPRVRGGSLTEQNVKLLLSIVSLCQLLSQFFHLILNVRTHESLPHGSKL